MKIAAGRTERGWHKEAGCRGQSVNLGFGVGNVGLEMTISQGRNPLKGILSYRWPQLSLREIPIVTPFSGTWRFY